MSKERRHSDPHVAEGAEESTTGMETDAVGRKTRGAFIAAGGLAATSFFPPLSKAASEACITPAPAKTPVTKLLKLRPSQVQALSPAARTLTKRDLLFLALGAKGQVHVKVTATDLKTLQRIYSSKFRYDVAAIGPINACCCCHAVCCCCCCAVAETRPLA